MTVVIAADHPFFCQCQPKYKFGSVQTFDMEANDWWHTVRSHSPGPEHLQTVKHNSHHRGTEVKRTNPHSYVAWVFKFQI